MWLNLLETAYLVTFTEEISNEKLQLLCIVTNVVEKLLSNISLEIF